MNRITVSGWVGNATRQVNCAVSTEGYCLTVAGVGQFQVAESGRAIRCLTAEPNISSKLIYEVLVGAPLVLALALQGRWCLHASAVARNGRIVAFVGDSGWGKSTLSAYLVGEGNGWQRVADDILPITQTAAGVVASSQFPQLKLPPTAQPPPDMATELPLAAVYLLTPPTTTAVSNHVETHPLNRYQATVTLVGHTVAARIFDKPLLAKHMNFCATAMVPVHQLIYPRRYDLLPEISDCLRGV